MKKQNYEKKSACVQSRFLQMKSENPERLATRLNLSWSNWGFGLERLADSAARLQRAGIRWIELHGNHYGKDLGYEPHETLDVLGDHGLKVAGICGMFSADNDLSSNRGVQRQAAIDYIRRELDFGALVGAHYMLVVPGAVGRSAPYDDSEFHRSAETLRRVADEFVARNIKAAVEPIRSAEVSLVHTVADVLRYIEAVNHPGVQHINGDVYHMQSEESHIGEALLAAGKRLTNLHMADSNRCALGDGSLDLDTIIMALYLIGYNRDGCFVTPEPLGPGGDPYPAMYGKPSPAFLDTMVCKSAEYFRMREDIVRGS